MALNLNFEVAKYFVNDGVQYVQFIHRVLWVIKKNVTISANLAILNLCTQSFLSMLPLLFILDRTIRFCSLYIIRSAHSRPLSIPLKSLGF